MSARKRRRVIVDKRAAATGALALEFVIEAALTSYAKAGNRVMRRRYLLRAVRGYNALKRLHNVVRPSHFLLVNGFRDEIVAEVVEFRQATGQNPV